ncbi:GlxA family transcriptional regulator [Salinarimonas ramus]|uniref:AraC family transcriptional regulator n=1 Tax=Salinarimonas ramus TaxID=690164 RepID=A0A917QBE3_9HYPH|nr:GlxA family transcriptional regulator [Salinarimonas ramus]GGK40372.1 AraC family transcriptional regulator [Salinarimonas ramus]
MNAITASDTGAAVSGEADAAGRAGTMELGFFLTPNFSMIAFTSAIEPFRLANYATGRDLYSWRLYSPDGAPVRGSNDVAVAADAPAARAQALDRAIVCGGNGIQGFDHRETIAALRRLSAHGAEIGAVCTGSWLLAKAGLLDGYRATIHWVYASGLTADFPDLEVSEELFEIDRNRFTCAGGMAAADMALSLVAQDQGADVASQVTDLLIHNRIREARERQRMDLRARVGVAHPRLLAVVQRMEETVEEPLPCAELARGAGFSQRQLERLFVKYLGEPPTRYYMKVRLQRARHLLRQTSLPVLEIALACGFVSASYFSKTYLEHFGRQPSAERKPQTRESMAVGGRPRRRASALAPEDG